MNRILLCFLLMHSLQSMAVIRYVTTTGAGVMNGSSWANAAQGNGLQAVINASGTGDEVWVACGTYRTTTGTSRTVYFSMRNNVAIYGSFQGNETLLSQRNLSCGPCSILSAEIGAAGIADNSYHVVGNFNLNNSAVIDGFVIQDANDNRPNTLTEGLGGGIYNQGLGAGNNSSPTIRNCVIRNNRATFGAGIFNSAFNGGVSSPVIDHCIITDNIAFDGGGGIDNFGLGGNASPTIINTLVCNNTAQTAGGMYCWGGNAGGNSNPILINCVFANNSATNGNAGAIIADNADGSGGFNSGTSNIVIRNTILWGNTASLSGPQFFCKGTGTVTATYSDIDLTGQNAPHIISGAGTGNIQSTPLFLNTADIDGADNCLMTVDDGFSLQAISPCVNAGDNTGVPLLDLGFRPRISQSIVDIGTYECEVITTPVRYIDIKGYAFHKVFRLQWRTRDETPGARFLIQKSKDGRSFQTIAVVDGKGLSTQYVFDDDTPFEEICYYRLECVDANGNSEGFSRVIVYKKENVCDLNLKHNSAQHLISLTGSATIQHMQLISADGTVVASIKNKNRLIYSNLQPGIYFLLVQSLCGAKVMKLRL